MSENLENQTDSQVENFTENTVEEKHNDSEQNTQGLADDFSEEKKNIYANDTLNKVLQKLVEKKQELENDKKLKEEYLTSSLANYDTEDYLQNPQFKSLYAEAFNALGTNLDTEKFVNLLDKYVESRIQSHIYKKSVQSENERITDGMDFKSGNSKNPDKNLRMQDIPPEELEKYIAKYI